MVQYPYRTTSHGIRLENIIPPTYSYSTHCQYDSLLTILSVFQKKYPSCREDNLSELISRLWFKSWHNYTTTTLVVESCRGGQHLLNHGHSATLSPPKNEFTRQWIWIYMFSHCKNTWPWWTSLSESTKRLMTNGNHDWVLDRTLLVATWVPWPQAWHSPPSRRKRCRASQWNFRKLSFEHLTSCGHSHENPKFLYVCIIIWYDIFASMIWEDAKRFQFIKPSGVCSGLAMLPLSLVDIPLARSPGVEFFTWVGIIISNLLGSS